jgi:hypothetical protein
MSDAMIRFAQPPHYANLAAVYRNFNKQDTLRVVQQSACRIACSR